MANSDNREIELKLAISPEDAKSFRRLALLKLKRAGAVTRGEVFNVYFDTPELSLANHAMALRLRRHRGQWSQTLKTAGNATGGLHQRGEWEFALPSPQLDLALFRDTPLASLAQSRALHLLLKPAFTTIFHRTAWQLDMAPGQRVEVVLDEGAIRSGEREARISEVEIELIEGDAATIFEVAFQLLNDARYDVTLCPDIVSKAERGYQLFSTSRNAAQHAMPVLLSRKLRRPEALQVILGNGLEHFQRNLHGALNFNDPEYVHQLRVALRRLRSALKIFKPADAGELLTESAWLASELGRARDWDVFVTQSLPALSHEFGHDKTAAQIMRLAEACQTCERNAAIKALATKRCAKLLLELYRHASLSQKPESSAGRQSLRKWAARVISRRHVRFLKRCESLSSRSSADQHRARIDAKRLRYAISFLGDLFDEEQVRRYAKIVGAIQVQLGHVVDDVVGMRLLNSLSPEAEFHKFSVDWFAARSAREIDRVEKKVAKLKRARKFWCQ